MSASNPIRHIATDRIAEPYRALGLAGLHDLELFKLASELIAEPKQEATSFSLHAPLEILARFRLLPMVYPEFHEMARLQMVRTAARYAQNETPAGPARPCDSADTPMLCTALLNAIERGSIDDAHAIAVLIGERGIPVEIRDGLATGFLRRLGAAGHAHIFLYLITLTDAVAGRIAARMLPGFARELARETKAVFEWTGPRQMAGGARSELAETADVEAIERALLASPLSPAGGGIYPIMHAAERAGLPRKVIDALLPREGPAADVTDQVFAAICRVAALAMIEDPVQPQQTKYGWTHCLTLPQAAWEISVAVPDHAFALRAAATYVVGMRAAIGRKAKLTADPKLGAARMPLAHALAQSPETAAAAAWHASADTSEDVFSLLATEASIRADAHLVKYVLACHDASRRNPSPVFVASAAYLTALWMKEVPVSNVVQSLGAKLP